MRGYFGIGIEDTKCEMNVGTLWRSAHAFGAAFIFTIGRRYAKRQATDTTCAWKHVPLYHYDDIDDFQAALPRDSWIIGIEIPGKRSLSDFHHPERAIYLLGAEDHGLSKKAKDICRSLVQIPSNYCLNVAATGSIVMYDRAAKGMQ